MTTTSRRFALKALKESDPIGTPVAVRDDLSGIFLSATKGEIYTYGGERFVHLEGVMGGSRVTQCSVMPVDARTSVNHEQTKKETT